MHVKILICLWCSTTEEDTVTCTINRPHCSTCGSTDPANLYEGDQGYTACCNEPVELNANDCSGGHDQEDTMTQQPTTNVTPITKKPAPRKTAAKAAPTKKEFNPTLTDKGRLDHTNCSHPRDPKGRAACRAEYAKAAKK